MEITERNTKLLFLTDIDGLDPVKVFLEDISENQGQITITCFGKAWTAYWGGTGGRTVAEFFNSCDPHYLANCLDRGIDQEVNDADAIKEQADKKGIECWRDDPWNDWDFLQEMYGSDPMEWTDSMPKKPNHEYKYLCKIILAIQDALKKPAAKAA